MSRLGDLRNLIYNDINGDPRFATQCDNCFDFAALAVSHAVRALLENVTDKDLHVFRVFEEYISILTEQYTRSFKKFSMRYERHADADGKSHYNQETLDEADSLSTATDLTALLELKDIEDELNMINRLFNEQSRTILEMETQFALAAPNYKRDSQAKSILEEVRRHIGAYQDQIKQTLSSSGSAQNSFNYLLDIKNTQANLDESRKSLRADEVAAEMSRSVMIFTVFTIMFLPLSFFTSLFGMNARDWSGTETNLSLHTIVVLMCSISASVIVVALLLAFNRAVRRKAHELSRTFWGWPLRTFIWLIRWRRMVRIVRRWVPDWVRELGAREDDEESGRMKLKMRRSFDSTESWKETLRSDRMQTITLEKTNC